MKRWTCLGCSALLLAAPVVASEVRADEPAQPETAQPESAQPETSEPGNTELYAESFQYDPATDTYTLTGNPEVVRGDTHLTADRITYQQSTGEATAEGNVVLTRGVRLVHATRMRYNTQTGEGRAENIRTVAEENFVRARVMDIHPDRWVAQRAHVTSCMGSHPHWELVAQRVILIPNERWVAREAGFNLFGRRLGTMHRVTHTLKKNKENKEEEQLVRQLMPTFGNNQHDGFFLHRNIQLLRNKAFAADLDVLLGTSSAFRGGLEVGTGGTLRVIGALGYRQDSPNQQARYMEVSRLPEVGLIWGTNTSAEAGRFLPTQIGAIGVPRSPLDPDRWRFATEVTGGYFSQRKGLGNDPKNVNLTGSRAILQAQAVRPRVRVGSVPLQRLRVMVRQSLYNTGDAYSVAGFGIGKDWKLGKLTTGIDHFESYTAGRTPFLFDQVELRTEWRPRLEYKTGGWDLSWIGRYDQNRGGFYDQTYSISRRMDCIEPRLTYDVRRAQVMLDLRLLGLEPGFNETPVRSENAETGEEGTSDMPATRRRGGR